MSAVARTEVAAGDQEDGLSLAGLEIASPDPFASTHFGSTPIVMPLTPAAREEGVRSRSWLYEEWPVSRTLL